MNILAVLSAALAAFVVGFLSHGPLFGKTWMRLAQVHPTGKENLRDMLSQMVWNYIANVLIAVVLSAAFLVMFNSALVGEPTWWRGALLAALAWLGFVVPISSYNVIWMNASKPLWLFELSTQLFSLMAMGAILAGAQ